MSEAITKQRQNANKVYETLKKAGYSGIGNNEDEFASLMEKDENRQKVYGVLKNKGYKGIGEDYNEFSSLLYAAPEPTPATPVEPQNAAIPQYDDEPNPVLKPQKPVTPPAQPEGEVVDTFGEGVVQGTKAAGYGVVNLAGETLNAFTGSSRDKAEAVQALDDRMTNPSEQDELYLQYKQKIDEAPTKKEKRRLARELANMEIEKGYDSFGALLNKYEEENNNLPLFQRMFAPSAYDKAQSQMQHKAKIDRIIARAIDAAGGDVDQARANLAAAAEKKTLGDKLTEYAQEGMSEMLPTQGFGAWVGNLIPQMVPSAAAIAVSVIGKNPKAAQFIGRMGMGTMVASTAGQSMAEARNAGATDGQVWATGITDGIVEYITEKIPFDRYTKRLTGTLKGKVTKELGDVLNTPAGKSELEDVLQRANRELGGKLFNKKNAKEFLLDVAAEGTSEFAAEAIQTITPMIYQNPEDYPTLSNVLENGWEGMKAGLFMGAILGGASKAGEFHINNKRRKEQGFVAVGEMDLRAQGGGENDVVEIFGVERDENGNVTKAKVMRDGQAFDIDPRSLKSFHTYTLEEFNTGYIQQQTDESYARGQNIAEDFLQITDGSAPVQTAPDGTPLLPEGPSPAQAMHDAQNKLKFTQQQMQEKLGVPDIDEKGILEAMTYGGATEEQVQIAIDYINAKSAYQGIVDGIKTDMNDRIQAAHNQIDANTNKDTGKIERATMKVEDRPVYIVGGYVCRNADGTIDKQRSEGSVIVKNIETGEVQMVSPEAIFKIDEPLDPVNEKNLIQEQIRQSAAQAAADAMDGKLAFQQGDTYTLTNNEGVQFDVQIVPNEQGLVDNGDGTINVILAPNGPGPKVISQMTKEEIQGLYEATQLARLQQYEMSKATEQAQEAQERQQTFNLNDEVTLRTEEGDVRGQIAKVEDGSIEVYTENPIGGRKVNTFTPEELNAMLIGHNGETIEQPAPAQEAQQQEQQPPVAEIPVDTRTALERIPVDENGEQLYEQAPVEDSYKALIEQTGNEAEALDVAEQMIKIKEAELAKVSKAAPKTGKSPKEIIAAKKEHADAVAKAQEAVNYWKNVLDFPAAQKRAAEAQAKMEKRMRMAEARRIQEKDGRYKKENAELGEPLSFREYIMRTIASGGIKFKWANDPNVEGLKGLGAHLGLNDQKTEMFLRGWALNKETGLYPEQAAEELLTGYMEEIGATDVESTGVDPMDALSEVLDVMLSYHGHRAMMDAAKELHGLPVEQAEEAYRASQQQSDIQGLEHISEEDILADASARIDEAKDEGLNIDVVGMKIIGSRLARTARPDSDLDILVEYSGDVKEDAVFNWLNAEESKMEMEGINVDFFPIRKEESGTMESWLKSHNNGIQAVEEEKPIEATTEPQATEVNASIEQARQDVNPEPTEAQKQAGNYKKGHIKLDGFDITLENAKGSVRRGIDETGKEWESEMKNDYGYLLGTEGVDGDHIDVFLSDNPSEGNVFVVDQVNPKTKEFDEHKVMYGFNSVEEAQAAYLSNYEEGWQGLGNITPVSKEEFKKWLDSSHRKTKPFAEYANVKPLQTETPSTPEEEAKKPVAESKEDQKYQSDQKIAEEEYAESLEVQGYLSAAPKKLSKIDIAKYAQKAKDDNLRPALNGVFHDKGLEVATDSHILVSRKATYDKSLEGKSILNGKEINAPFPAWRDLFKQESTPESIDFERLSGFIQAAKADERYTKGIKEGMRIGIRLANGEVSYYKANLLEKFVEFARSIEGKPMSSKVGKVYGASRLEAINGEQVALLMPTKLEGKGLPGYNCIIFPTAEEEAAAKARKLNNAVSEMTAQVTGKPVEEVKQERHGLYHEDHQKAIDIARNPVGASEEEIKAALDVFNWEVDNAIAESFVEGKDEMTKAAIQETIRIASTGIDVLKQEPHRRELQQSIDKIATDKATVVTAANVATAMKDNNQPQEDIAYVRENLQNNKQECFAFRDGDGNIYLISDNIANAEEARDWYVHERQHNRNRSVESEREALNEIQRVASPEQILDYLHNVAAVKDKDGRIIALNTTYDDADVSIWADELLSYAMQIAYKCEPDALEEELRQIGLDNEDIINFVKTIDNEQRKDEHLSAARNTGEAHNNVNATAPGRGEQNERAQESRPGDVASVQSTGVPEGSEETTGGRKSAEPVGRTGRKIEDYGEEIAGARKFFLQDLSKKMEKVTEQALIANPFAKVFSKPDFGKLVENGSIREIDAMVGEAICATIYPKPKSGTKKDRMATRLGRLTEVEKWAKQTNQFIQKLNDYLSSEPAQRDAFLNGLIENPFDSKEKDDEYTRQLREWNKGQEIKDLYNVDPVWFAYKVLEAYGYSSETGVPKTKLPTIVRKINRYDIVNNSGYVASAQSLIPEEIAQEVADFVKFAEGKPANIPMSRISARSTGSKTTGDVEDWMIEGITRRGNYWVKRFPTKEEAAEALKKAVADGNREVSKEPKPEYKRVRNGFVIYTCDVLSGEKIELSDKKYETSEEVKDAIEQEYDSIVEQLNAVNASIKGIKPTAKSKLIVCQVYGDHGWAYCIGYTGPAATEYSKKTGSSAFIPLKEFKTRKEAEEYLNANKDELLAPFDAIEQERKDFVFFDTKQERIGADYRNGKDVTAEQFANEFGFRGVQFGNWANDKDRQMALNQAYDAMLDLSKITGLSPRALSLNGELGIAFGARGTGNANAHYELDNVVINLTKTRGAGSLAHEWLHAIDNYFSRQNGDAFGMVTAKGDVPGMRIELQNRLFELMHEVKKSDYYKRSKANGDYWGRDWEVMARLFAEYCNDKLETTGETNKFLSRGIDPEKFDRVKRRNYILYKLARWEQLSGNESEKFISLSWLQSLDMEGIKSYEEWLKDEPNPLGSFPYPTKDETAALTPALEVFFNSIKESEQPDGKVLLFAKRPIPAQDSEYAAAVQSGDMAEAKRLVEEEAAREFRGTKVADKEGKPVMVRHLSASQFTEFENGYGPYKGSLGFFTDEMEAVDKIIEREGLDENKIYNCYLNLQRPLVIDLKGQPFYDIRGIDGITDGESTDIVVERAYRTGKYDGVILRNVGDEFAGRIPHNIDDYIPFFPEQVKLADPVTFDINGDVVPVSKRFKHNRDIRFAKANQTQNGFVSNAAAAIERVKMEKATPAQWKAMIAKEGGLKTAEDKWLGLSEWLDESTAKTLTKDEVMGFVNENAIQIEEELYGEIELSKLQQEYDEIYDGILNGIDDEVVMSPDKMAWEELNARHHGGDDFDMAFSLGKNLQIEVDDEDRAGYFLGVKPINSTRLDYTSEGLNNKREIALTVPTIDPWNETDDVHFGDAGDGRAVAWVRFGDTNSIIDRRVQTKYAWEKIDGSNFVNKKDIYRPFKNARDYIVDEGEKGFALYVNEKYFNDYSYLEDAEYAYELLKPQKVKSKILFIDEIQSKRHQEGRDKGYADNSEIIKAKKEKEAYKKEKEDFLNAMFEKYGKSFDREMNSDEMVEWQRVCENLDAVTFTYNRMIEKPRIGVPAAPFEKNWQELAFKRMLRLAAEEGYDKVAWTTGDTQAERYSLSKAFNSIEREDYPSDEGERRFVLSGDNAETVNVNENGQIISSSIGEIEGRSLHEVVGKDMAVKMMSLNDGDVISGDELKIGGEGMKGFYDQIIPSFVNKYCKKWGVSVADAELDNLGQTAHVIDVTPEMKRSVLEGQVMFAKKPKAEQTTTPAFKEWFGDWEAVANVKNGIEALKQLANGKEKVEAAMRREELKDLGGTAEIAFEWGKEGIPDKDGIIRKGFGFAKIVQKHGANDAIRVIGTIAYGSIGEPYGVEGGQRVNITSGEYQTTISLFRNGERGSWVLTGYKIDNNLDAKGRGSDLSNATQTNPIRTRDRLGASLSSDANVAYFNELTKNVSKIVDENGNPLIVYHGTKDDFNVFETGKLGTRYAMGFPYEVKSQGFFFSADKNNAISYANQQSKGNGETRVIPAYIKMTNPADLSKEDYESEKLFADIVGQWPSEYNPLEHNVTDYWQIADLNSDQYDIDLPKRLNELGYDGIIFAEKDGHKSYFVIRPEQIKSAIDNNGDFDSTNPDIRFAKAPAERSLVGIHNIGAAQLRKAIALGGLANPSTAVIDIDKQAFDKYGEISLLMPSSLVDARTGRHPGTAAADLYSPNYPTVHTMFSSKDRRALQDWITEKVGDPNKANKLGLFYTLEDNLERGNDPVGLEYIFVKEKGAKNIDAYEHDGLNPEWKEIVTRYDSFDSFSKAYKENTELQESVDKLIRAQFIREYVANRKKELGETSLFSKPEIVKEAVERAEKQKEYGEFAYLAASTFTKQLEAYKNNGEFDKYDTLYNVSNYIYENDLRDEYNKWVVEQLKPFNPTEKLYVGTDYEGRAKYIPNTLENASKIMRKKGYANADTFFDMSLGGVRAEFTPIMRTLNEIRNNRLRLDEEAFEKAKDELEARYQELASKFDRIDRYEFDAKYYRLIDTMKQPDPAAFAEKEFKVTLFDDDVQDIKDFAAALRQMPTAYFELKFQRPVLLDEFAAAVVPDNVDPAIIQTLEDSGLEVYKYDHTKEDSRVEVTREASRKEGIRFAKAPKANADYAAAVEVNDKPALKKMIVDAAAESMPNTKVVDRYGKPRVVYHGTAAELPFNEFKDNVTFFTTNRSTANEYTHHRGIFSPMPKQTGRVMPCFINLENPLIVDANRRLYTNIPVDFSDKPVDVVAIIDYAMANGHDGVIIKRVKDNMYTDDTMVGDDVISFNPVQIKSAGPTYETRERSHFPWDRYEELMSEIGPTYDDLGRLIPISERFSNKRDIRFAKRTKPAPEKTGIGYKVFVQRDGKLYPPMVANPGGAETPVGVWLDADAAPIAAMSKSGRPQVKAGGKGTQGGSGTLAYRPGWHLGEIPFALQFNRKDANGEKTLFPGEFVWAEVEYAADRNYQKEAEAEGMTEEGKFRHSYAGLKAIPEDGFYRYRTNPNPATDPWVITGSMKVKRVLSNAEVDALVIRAGRKLQMKEGVTPEMADKAFYNEVRERGLADFFGKKEYGKYLGEVYQKADIECRKKITEMAINNGMDFNAATQEYLGGFAKTDDYPAIIGTARDILADKTGRKLTEKQFRYLMWREQSKPEGAMGIAEDVVVRGKLGLDGVRFAKSPVNPGSAPSYAVPAQQIYERRVATAGYQFTEAMQDSMLGLKRMYEAVTEAEGKKLRIEDIPDFENAYLAENAMSSVNLAESDAFSKLVFKPILEEVKKLAATEDAYAELIDYMMAKHGLERNVYMNAKAQAAAAQAGGVWAGQRDYAGLTDLTGDPVDYTTKAADMVAAYEAAHNTAELWKKIKTMNDATLAKMYEGGLMSADTFNQIRTMYQNYIPLRGFEDTISSDIYGYLRGDKDGAFTAPIRRAEGRTSKADDPLATMANMADNAILQANRNLMKQKALNFALNHPSDLVSVNDLWLKKDAVTGEWKPVTPQLTEGDSPAVIRQKTEAFEKQMAALAQADPDNYKRGKEAVNIPYKTLPADLTQHQVLIKRGGRSYVMTINGSPRAAQALNGETNPDNNFTGAVGALMDAGLWINRNLSSFYTTRYPDFVLSNTLRDMLYGNSIVWVRESPAYAARFNKNYATVNPVRLYRLLKKYDEGTLDMRNPVEKALYEFILNGGETGWTNIKNIEKQKKAIKKELRKATATIPVEKFWDYLGDKLDYVNRATENCARFAAFLTSRQMGRTLQRSVYDAKESTVNFNKKGAGSKFYKAQDEGAIGNLSSLLSGSGRSLFVFWNAAIQGTTNFFKEAQPERNQKKWYSLAASMFVAGLLMYLLNCDDDETESDEKNKYLNQPESVRRSNILFRAGNQYVSLPLPVEYRMLYGMGELAGSVLAGREEQSAGEVATKMAGQLTQVLPIDFMEGGGKHGFIPSAVKPAWEAYVMNEGWTGLPIYKDNDFNKNKPSWTKAYSNVSTPLFNLAKALNPDPYYKSGVDINPARLEYMLNGYFGGYYKTANELVKMAETVAGTREFDWRNIMLANRVFKTGDERTQFRKVNEDYYKYLKEYNVTTQRLNGYTKENDGGEDPMQYAEKLSFLYFSPEYMRHEIMKDYKKQIDKIGRQMKDAHNDDEYEYLKDYQNLLKQECVEVLKASSRPSQSDGNK